MFAHPSFGFPKALFSKHLKTIHSLPPRAQTRPRPNNHALAVPRDVGFLRQLCKALRMFLLNLIEPHKSLGPTKQPVDTVKSNVQQYSLSLSVIYTRWSQRLSWILGVPIASIAQHDQHVCDISLRFHVASHWVLGTKQKHPPGLLLGPNILLNQ